MVPSLPVMLVVVVLSMVVVVVVLLLLVNRLVELTRLNLVPIPPLTLLATVGPLPRNRWIPLCFRLSRLFLQANYELDPPIMLIRRVTLTIEFLWETFLLQSTLNLVDPKGGVTPPPIIPMCAWPFIVLLLPPKARTWWTLRCMEVQNPRVPLLAAALGPLKNMLTPLCSRPTKTVAALVRVNVLATPCSVRSTSWVRKLIRSLFTLFLTLVPGIRVVIELTMTMLSVLE